MSLCSQEVLRLTKMDTRCQLCTISLNECGSAFLFFYLKMILGFINLLKFSLVHLLLANGRFFLWKIQLQFKTRTVKCKILTGMIKILVSRIGFSEIIFISPNIKGENWEVFLGHKCQITACLQSVSAILIFICLQHLKSAPISVVFHTELS